MTSLNKLPATRRGITLVLILSKKDGESTEMKGGNRMKVIYTNNFWGHEFHCSDVFNNLNESYKTFNTLGNKFTNLSLKLDTVL